MKTKGQARDKDDLGDNGEASAKIGEIIGGTILALREEKSRERVQAGKKKLTQAVLAQELSDAGHDVSAAQIGHIETGRKSPSFALLIALAEYFDVSVEYVMGRTKKRSTVAKLEKELRAGAFSGELGRMYEGLSAKRQEEVYRFVSGLHLSQNYDNEVLTTLRSIRNGLIGLDSAARGEESMDRIMGIVEERIRDLTAGNEPVDPDSDGDDSNDTGEADDSSEKDT